MYDQATYVDHRYRSAGPPWDRRLFTITRRQLIRNRDRQIQRVHDRPARRPYRYGSITQRGITAGLQLEWGADDTPAWHGKPRGCLRRYPGREVLNFQPHVAAEISQGDQVNGIRVVETVEGSTDVARFYRSCATNTARQPTTHDVTHEGGRLVVRGEREGCRGDGRSTRAATRATGAASRTAPRHRRRAYANQQYQGENPRHQGSERQPWPAFPLSRHIGSILSKDSGPFFSCLPSSPAQCHVASIPQITCHLTFTLAAGIGALTER